MVNRAIDFTFHLLILLALCFHLGCTCEGSKCPGNQPLKTWMSNNGKLKVLCTIGMLEDIVKDVGGDAIDTLTLIGGDLDPHSYQLVKGDDEKLTFADVIFYNGLGLEHGPSLQTYLANNDKAVGVGYKIQEEDSSLIIKIEGQVDPHIWMDISLWTKAVPYVVETLSLYLPDEAAGFQSRGEKLMKEMLQAHQEVTAVLNEVPSQKRYLVTSHDAFYYFSRAYLADEEERLNGRWIERFAAPEGLAPESQLSTQDIKEILDYLNQYQISVIFPESNVSQDSIRKIVDVSIEQGVGVVIAECELYGDAMGPEGSDGDSYIKMIQHNAKVIANHLIWGACQHDG